MDEDRPSSQVAAEYYGRYEEAFDLAVVRPVRVRSVRSSAVLATPLVLGSSSIDEAGAVRPPEGIRRDTLLEIEWERADTGETGLLRARMIVNATGTWTRPYRPSIPGADSFRGRVLDTTQYVRAQDFADERVLVVGGGLSAVQFLLELAPVAASTAWATRRPPNFTALDFDAVWGAEVERAVDERTATGAAPASVVRTTGIPRLPEYLEGVRSGVFVSRGMFDLIGASGVRFSPRATLSDPGALGPSGRRAPSGGLVEPDSWRPFPTDTWVEVDTIFWNTGFRACSSSATVRGRRPSARRAPGARRDGSRWPGSRARRSAPSERARYREIRGLRPRASSGRVRTTSSPSGSRSAAPPRRWRRRLRRRG